MIATRWKIASIALLLSGFACTAASATTLTFESANGDIYPYEMQIDGAGPEVPMDCINNNLYVTTGETWQVTVTDLQTLSTSIDGYSVTALDEDAYLDSLYNTSPENDSNGEIQQAIWSILDPNHTRLNNAERSLVEQAENDAPAAGSSFYSQFTLYTPVLTHDIGWTRGQPQSFFQYNPHPPVTPEPSSLILLGTGILGAGFLVRRRMHAVTKA